MCHLDVHHHDQLLEAMIADQARNIFWPLLGNPVKRSGHIDGIKLCPKGVDNVQDLPAFPSACDALADLCWVNASLHRACPLLWHRDYMTKA